MQAIATDSSLELSDCLTSTGGHSSNFVTQSDTQLMMHEHLVNICIQCMHEQSSVGMNNSCFG